VSATLPFERRRLGRSEITIPRVALGCGNFGGVGSAPELFGQGLTQDEAFELMDAAWEQGIDHFDTADAYGGGRSETMIGAWMRSRRVRPLLTTKTYNPMDAGADRGLAPERVERQLESSLERLGVERVDLYLAHEFDFEVPLDETFAAIERQVDAGKVAAFVSGRTFDQLEQFDRLAHARAISMAGLALAWLLADERITQIVVGPGRPEHLAPVREAIERPLSTEERTTLDEVFS
jgi:aryl-alcohol dehydrogenase-like predicted oxidoreductase